MKREFITPKIISQKCRYALRAIFELASRDQSDVTKISELAAAQNVPPRFLENILVELKQAGFVVSKRGNEGGYMLASPAEKLTVGQVIAFVQGNSGSNFAASDRDLKNGDYAFSQLWQRLNDAISNVYDKTTFAGLIEDESKATKDYVPNYVI
ncbi:MAG: Rrf2 family transcriptional regulator [Sedimentisphaerales bacterium]|nr:Rrf2 family transcriptional regulator [Sedimentisphaerales bacterium]